MLLLAVRGILSDLLTSAFGTWLNTKPLFLRLVNFSTMIDRSWNARLQIAAFWKRRLLHLQPRAHCTQNNNLFRPFVASLVYEFFHIWQRKFRVISWCFGLLKRFLATVTCFLFEIGIHVNQSLINTLKLTLKSTPFVVWFFNLCLFWILDLGLVSSAITNNLSPGNNNWSMFFSFFCCWFFSVNNINKSNCFTLNAA